MQHLNSLGAKPSQHVYVVSMPAIESSYCIFMTTGPSTFSDSDIASLMVLNEYLSTMEGPFWKQVRGNGLAYGASLRLAIESCMLVNASSFPYMTSTSHLHQPSSASLYTAARTRTRHSKRLRTSSRTYRPAASPSTPNSWRRPSRA